MRRTSSRRSICLHPGENGRCTDVIENSEVRMSRFCDTSTETQMAKIMVQYGRPSCSSWAKSVRSSFGRAIMEKAIWENPSEVRLGEGFQLGMFICSPRKRTTLICVCGPKKKTGWKETEHRPNVESTHERRWLGRTNIIPWPCSFACALNENAKRAKILWTITGACLDREFPRGELQNFHTPRIFVFPHGPMIWSVMPRNVWNDIVSWQTKQLNNSTKYLLHASMTTTSKKKNWNPCENCQKYALKLFWNACTWLVLGDLISCGPWTNLLVLSLNGPMLVTKAWIGWFHTFITHVNTNNIAMWVILPNNADLGLFQDSDFAEDLEDSKSTSGGTLCVFGSHTFVPTSWMCKKQTSVSHSSIESEIIFLDARLRLDGIPALNLWDLIVAFLGNTYQSNQEQGDPYTNFVRVNPHKLPTRKKFHGMIDDLDNVDFISSNVHSSRQEALLYIFEDNEAVI